MRSEILHREQACSAGGQGATHSEGSFYKGEGRSSL